MASPDNQSMNEMTSENYSTTNVTMRSSRLGLLSLPPELRVLVFRNLLIEDRPLLTYLPSAEYQPFPAILSTCRQIRQEAFQVLYGENVFRIYMDPIHSILNNQQIRDTIQNIHFDLRLNNPWRDLSRFDFFRVVRGFLSPAIVRGTLSFLFHIEYRVEHVAELLPSTDSPDCFHLAQVIGREICERYENAFTPVFGPATSLAEGCGRLFHPQSFFKSLPPKAGVDWMNYLDGIRLNWNQDPLMNADQAEGENV